IYNDNWSERYHGLKEVAVGEETKEKKDTAGGTTAKGTGTGGGFGGRKKGPPEAEIEAELIELIEAFDPEDQRSGEELEKQIAALKAKLAELKKAEGTLAVAPPPRLAGELAKAPPPMKFEIHVPTNAELAANLKGHLLLVHGEIDNNVHPANTMRLVDALIKANKRFDMLILPGKRHGFADYQPYFTQRMWEFFAEHLLGDRRTGADLADKRDSGR